MDIKNNLLTVNLTYMKNLSELVKQELINQEQEELNIFYKKFFISKKAKMEQLEKLGELPQEKRDEFNFAGEILENRMELHKEGKQNCDDIINILGQYANDNFTI